jgi:cobalt-zinc-cadmium efflux system protein
VRHEDQTPHRHDSGYKRVAFSRLGWSLAITLTVMVIEAAGGWISGSIALISDAGHMATHAFAIGVSMFGILAARRPRCHHRTFGLLRAEVLAAFVNGIFLLLICAWIVVESVRRFLAPTEILTAHMLLVALLGLLVNLISMALLESSRHNDLNVRSVFLHMIGDAASSVAVVLAAVVIRYTHWLWLDPAVSLIIAALIAVWAIGLLRESARVLLEMAPRGRDVHQITDALQKQFPAILAIDHEHLWTITEQTVLFSAHLRVDAAQLPHSRLSAWLEEVEDWLEENHGIAESTLQTVWAADREDAIL